jgi:hypothetical protein
MSVAAGVGEGSDILPGQVQLSQTHGQCSQCIASLAFSPCTVSLSLYSPSFLLSLIWSASKPEHLLEFVMYRVSSQKPRVRVGWVGDVWKSSLNKTASSI